MTNAKLDILCLSGQDESTNMIKQSDLTILVSELGSKKVEINIIDNINDLTFKNPIFIHDFSDCLNNKKKLQIFISKYIKVKNKLLVNDGNNKLNDRNNTLWNTIIPRLCLDTLQVSRYLDTTLDTLVKVRKLKIPFLKMLETGIISYALNRLNAIYLIKQFMKDKKVSKAYVRFGHGNNPSFMVDLNDTDSFNIDFDKYTDNKISLSSIAVHPIRSTENYMKGVISVIFIDGKYSHSIIKKPIDMNVGIRKYKVVKYSPDYSLLRTTKDIVRQMNIGKKFPIIQIN